MERGWAGPVELAGVGFSEERRVSWRPGAEGAPLGVVEVVVVVEVEWEDGGTRRRDCGGVSGRVGGGRGGAYHVVMLMLDNL